MTSYRYACLLVVFGSVEECYDVKNGTYLPFLCLWREKNNRSFEDVEKSSEEILSSFYHTLYLWYTAYAFP
jgi:hypothetical protein